MEIPTGNPMGNPMGNPVRMGVEIPFLQQHCRVWSITYISCIHSGFSKSCWYFVEFPSQLNAVFSSKSKEQECLGRHVIC